MIADFWPDFASAPRTWLVLGFVGQALFTARFLTQWAASERAGETVVPRHFWWLSLLGGLSLCLYAVARRDPVVALGQSIGLIIYGRNLVIAERRPIIGANPRKTGREPAKAYRRMTRSHPAHGGSTSNARHVTKI